MIVVVMLAEVKLFRYSACTCLFAYYHCSLGEKKGVRAVKIYYRNPRTFFLGSAGLTMVQVVHLNRGL